MTPPVDRPAFTFADGVTALRAGELTAEEAAGRLIAQLTDAELLWLLDGDIPAREVTKLPARIRSGPVTAGALPRLGIPGIRFSDGPRGVVIGRSTAFPVTMMRAATWDPELEERVGHAMGLEARARGANYSGAVCVNLLRHPAWGRAQECYGEDPVLTGRMAAGLTRGLRRNVMACVKHFALNSIENARFRVDVSVDEHALHEVYLPHFRAVIDAGADSVMSAYNSVNGRFAAENPVLLTGILRGEWGFRGFVTSDWVWGTHDAVASLEAGLDIEMPLRMLRARALPAALRDGRAARDSVLRSARRILATTLRHTAQRDETDPAPGVVAGPAHRALARLAAVRGAVLLRNEPVGGGPVGGGPVGGGPAGGGPAGGGPAGGGPALPLPPGLRRLAVIGPLAGQPNLGDRGSSQVHPPATCSILDGLREALPGTHIAHEPGARPAAAARAAQGAEAAVVVVGLGARDEGERLINDDPASLGAFGFPLDTPPARAVLGLLMKGLGRLAPGGDRASLTLRRRDERLIAAVAAACPRTVVVLTGGSAILMESWRHRVPAILLAWYPGMEGGRAIADVLTGAQEPGGRLPLAIPTSAGHLPFFDATARRIRYDAWWGQRKLDRDGHPAAYPFGFGLGYTTFTMVLTGHQVDGTGGVAQVRVANTGPRPGSAVVQVYAADADTPRPVPRLLGFRRVPLGAGEQARVDVELDLTPVRERDPLTRAWARRPGTWLILAAPHSPGSLDGGHPLSGG